MMMLSMNMIFISPFLKHPISLGSLILMQSILTSTSSMLMSKNSWFSFILFITFSGGLMIMFIYMSSIASNEKFKFSIKLLTMILIMNMVLMLYKDKMLLFSNKWMESTIQFQTNEEKLSILKFLTSSKKFLSKMLIVIILITLISVTNIVNSFEGPLKKTYEKIYTKNNTN
uniref:NADH dehydrogenase subunit 6 n=1 Tax=Iolania perkinsi TaxID=2831208 RepID=A0A8K1HZA6_9HEMI|nr:NADH dehydrogenase subunit 6 [Iolania perkinsi]